MEAKQDIVFRNDITNRLIDNIDQVIFGKRDVIVKVICALIAQGHVLIEDIPGVGKTLMVNALAKSLSLSFSRIQCTPDVMPSDIVGFNILSMQTGKMEFKKGMIMNQLVLADEINRAAPKTQSSLLEAMEENQVSVDGVTYAIPQPFMVLATQNPIEFTGTTLLPEAQLDRFMIRVSLGYPSFEDEMDILSRYSKEEPIDSIMAIAGAEDIIDMQRAMLDVFVSPAVKKYITTIIRETRGHQRILLGASPRAALALLKMSQAFALVNNRKFVAPDDVQHMAASVLGHRLVLKQDVFGGKLSADVIIKEIISQIKVP